MPLSFQELRFSKAKRKRTGVYKTCPQCGIEFYLPPHRIREGEQYCTKTCRQAATPKVTKQCPVCLKEFTVLASVEDRYTVCSIECRHASVRKYECQRCGKMFQSSEGRWIPKYCSESCYRPAVYTNCDNCGKRFRRMPGADARRFCNLSCYRKYTGETSIEKEVRLFLERCGVPYIQEAKIGRYSCDFLLQHHDIVLECDGDYWHSKKSQKARDQRKTKYLESKGLTVIRLTEQDITNNFPKVGAAIVPHVYP